MFALRKKRHSKYEIDPDEIFLDSSNLPEFDTQQFEGHIEKPIARSAFVTLGILCLSLGILFLGRAYILQIKQGNFYAEKSENNRLKHSIVFADRGLIKDRNGEDLAWNIPSDSPDTYSVREYIKEPGFNNLLGFVKYPSKDNNGFYYTNEISGVDGVEKYFNDKLSGKDGLMIVETNASGKDQSNSTIRYPEHGDELRLTLDARIQKALYNNIKASAETSGFQGGAGVFMNIKNGEVLAITTYPEYDSNTLTNSTSSEAVKNIMAIANNPFLDRSISGLYAPGSIMKPFIGLGALNEGVIDSSKQIESKGLITIPNPYFPDKPSVFRDWRVNGWTDLKHAIAVSSDVYFYAIGGGYEDQKGMGILLIDKYAALFGFGSSIQNSFFSGKAGVVPNPEWKAKVFKGDPWRLGDTYTSSIGQFGFQVTPIQAVRAVAALANNGTMVDPVLIKDTKAKEIKIPHIDLSYYKEVQEGMRLAVTEGTMTGLSFPYAKIAGKTGTAEVGSEKKFINSWVIGYFPYDDPKYAFAMVLEKGPSDYREGAQAAMKNVFINLASSTPDYFEFN